VAAALGAGFGVLAVGWSRWQRGAEHGPVSPGGPGAGGDPRRL